jgi:hypothetical protein
MILVFSKTAMGNLTNLGRLQTANSIWSKEASSSRRDKR